MSNTTHIFFSKFLVKLVKNEVAMCWRLMGSRSHISEVRMPVGCNQPLTQQWFDKTNLDTHFADVKPVLSFGSPKNSPGKTRQRGAYEGCPKTSKDA